MSPFLSRRDALRYSGLGLLGASMSGWFPALAARAADDPKRTRHCILLWMTGGPTQTDTFDMKPGHANGGEFKEAATSTPGVRFSEHLPKLAQHADRMAIIRSLSTKEGDHGRGTFAIRTGHQPGGPLRYPTIGSLLSKELGSETASLPNYVSISPYTAFNPAAFSPGFLGPRYAAATVGERATFDPQQAQQQPDEAYAELGVDYLVLPPGVTRKQAQARLELWDSLQKGFLATRRAGTSVAQDTVYRRAVTMMQSDAASAFDLSEEPDAVRAAYGRTRFGQGCLMARRLIERGVPFIEISLGFESGNLGWDTHAGNFAAVRTLSGQLDAGWGTLMTELKDRGLLDSTTILWIGEFGRTPKINENAGRDHFPNAWSCVLAGGGIAGGQFYGKTSDDGEEVTDGKVDIPDVLATLCRAVGVDPEKENVSEQGRPIKLAEGKPIEEVLA
jgi:hypothetical protein